MMMQFGRVSKPSKALTFWVRFDKFKVVKRKGAVIIQTSKIGHDWFTFATRPTVNAVDADGVFWASTTIGKLSAEKPTD